MLRMMKFITIRGPDWPFVVAGRCCRRVLRSIYVREHGHQHQTNTSYFKLLSCKQRSLKHTKNNPIWLLVILKLQSQEPYLVFTWHILLSQQQAIKLGLIVILHNIANSTKSI